MELAENGKKLGVEKTPGVRQGRTTDEVKESSEK
jgi:hypothetical protein